MLYTHRTTGYIRSGLQAIYVWDYRLYTHRTTGYIRSGPQTVFGVCRAGSPHSRANIK